MTAKKAFYVMCGAIGICATLLVAVVFFGNKLMFSESEQLVNVKATNEVLNNQELNLSKAKSEVQKYQDLEQITQSIIPRDKDQARAIREIVSLSEASGFQLKSITFPASSLGSAVQKSTGSTSDSTTPSASTKKSISQAKPVDGVKGVYSLEASIEPATDVSYYQFIDFLSRLENNRRTAQVSRISITPKSSSNSNPAIRFNLTLNIFLKP